MENNTFTLTCNKCGKSSTLKYTEVDDGIKYIEHSDIHVGYDYVSCNMDVIQFKCEYCHNKLVDGLMV